jgi:hypothetical protein
MPRREPRARILARRRRRPSDGMRTIDQLFELGPDHFTPGSKMPMQQIAKLADRQDLIAYLRENTGSREGPVATGGSE